MRDLVDSVGAVLGGIAFVSVFGAAIAMGGRPETALVRGIVALVVFWVIGAGFARVTLGAVLRALASKEDEFSGSGGSDLHGLD